MAKLRIYGDTSGYVDLKVSDVANNGIFVLDDLITVNNINDYTGYANGAIIETIAGTCDGQTVHGLANSFTLETVTGAYTLGATYTDVTGSSINYQPPAEATKVIYEYSYSTYWGDAHSILHNKLFIDGTEVLHARHNNNGQYRDQRSHFMWVFDIDGTADANTGAQSTWTTGKIIKMQNREYGSSNETSMHGTYYWDGTASVQFSKPVIKITAIK